MTDAGTARMVIETVQSTLSALDWLSITDSDVSFREHRPPTVQFWTLTRLQILELSRGIPPTAAQLQALALFPNLKSLRLNVDRMLENDAGGTNTIVGFSKLQYLAISGLTGCVEAFVTAISPPVLDSLEVTVSHTHFMGNTAVLSTHQYQNDIESLHARIPPSVRHYRLVIVTKGWDVRDCIYDIGKVFKPLRSLRSLQSLEFAFLTKEQVPLPNTALDSLRDAWPELHAFKFFSPDHYFDMDNDIDPDYDDAQPERRSQHHYRTRSPARAFRPGDLPTLSAIAAFAQAHPHLRELHLPSIDLLSLPDVDLVPILDHPLRDFRVHDLTPGIPLLDCALMLDLLFPHLSLHHARSARIGRRMDELSLLLLAIQSGRSGTYRTRAERLGGYQGDIPISTRTERGFYLPPPSPTHTIMQSSSIPSRRSLAATPSPYPRRGSRRNNGRGPQTYVPTDRDGYTSDSTRSSDDYSYASDDVRRPRVNKRGAWYWRILRKCGLSRIVPGGRGRGQLEPPP
ncbi:hypothetical protein BN946_scf184936.g8 [Trametes cinnabarina]|uniref:F-box domain-containing protein n=1 Tax=Pycnoporus cinnabarinus TaxID=5643 RepID=A0A060SYE6_PYCCI|nr:hypothetical protein BN946_scf184936.g8 [Trametes cinnabarina]